MPCFSPFYTDDPVIFIAVALIVAYHWWRMHSLYDYIDALADEVSQLGERADRGEEDARRAYAKWRRAVRRRPRLLH